MTVSAITNEAARANLAAALNQGSSGNSTSASATQEMSDRFLKLLVTQLKNQDPMNPMENAELTMQLAQMSTVEGIAKMNTTLEGLASQFRADQVLQGAALVGRQVMAEGDDLVLTSAGAAGGLDLDSSAGKVSVRILDASGALVRELDLGAMPAGFNRFIWDGLDANGVQQPEGNYSFQASASAGDSNVGATAYALGSVLSVSLEDGGMNLEISGLGMRGMGQVKQVF